jgi:dTDP-4-amino-4,6-dideoxygalactose transaminase
MLNLVMRNEQGERMARPDTASLKSGLHSVLAVNGGVPIRQKPLPLEFPGGHFIDQEEWEAVLKVLKKKSPFRYYGLAVPEECNLFEKEFAAFCQRRFALGVNSGTAALSIALAALGAGPGQEVLVPGYMWVSVVSAVVRSGAIPVLVDVDETLGMNPADMERKITRKTSLAVVVHMSGAPGRLDEILAIAARHKLRVLGDCAQANGASYNGRPVGSFGDIALFSFQLNKNMTTGEGGMLVTDDEHLYKRIFACHDLGFARDAAGRLDTSDARYLLWGQGSRMTEMTAAMGRVQLRKLPEFVRRMRSAKYQLKEGIENIEGLAFRHIMDPTGDSGAFLFTIFPRAEICSQFVTALRGEGIVPPTGGLSNIPMKEWGLHIYYNIVSLVNKSSISADGYPWTHPANQDSDYDYGRGALPSLDDLVSRSALLCIPPVLTNEDVQDIVQAYHKVAAYIPLK